MGFPYIRFDHVDCHVTVSNFLCANQRIVTNGGVGVYTEMGVYLGHYRTTNAKAAVMGALTLYTL